MSDVISRMRPERWKLFQCLYIRGENDGRVDDLLVTRDEFDKFVARHIHLSQREKDPIAMYGSTEDTKNGYACITPAGCFLEDVDNKHKYSRPILSVGVTEAWKYVFDKKRKRTKIILKEFLCNLVCVGTLHIARKHSKRGVGITTGSHILARV